MAYRPSSFDHEAKHRAVARELSDVTKQDLALRRGSVWAHDSNILTEQRVRGFVAFFLPLPWPCSSFFHVLAQPVEGPSVEGQSVAAWQDEMKTLLRNFELFTAASINAEVWIVELLLLWKNLGQKRFHQ